MSDSTTPPLAPPTAPSPSGDALPPPSPPPDATGASPTARARARAGQLTPAWRLMVLTTWVGVFMAYLAVWKASEEIGLATWWLGARSNPQPLVIRLVPFIVTAVFGTLSSYNTRRLALLGVIGAVCLAAIAVPDLSRSTGLATIEFAIAGAVLLVSLASFTGTYRQPTSHDAG